MTKLILPGEGGELGTVGPLVTVHRVTSEALEGPIDAAPDSLSNLVDEDESGAARQTAGAILHLPEPSTRNTRDVAAAPSLGVRGQSREPQGDMGGGFPLPRWRQRQLGMDEQGRTATPLHDHS